MVKSLLSYVFEEKLLRKGKLLVFWTWPSLALNLYWRWFVLLTAFLPVMSWVVNCAGWWLVKVVRGGASLKGREIWIKPVRLPTSNMLQLNLAAASADTSILQSLWSSHCDYVTNRFYLIHVCCCLPLNIPSCTHMSREADKISIFFHSTVAPIQPYWYCQKGFL